MFRALASKYEELTPQEIRRNIKGDDRLYVSVRNKAYGFIKEFSLKRIDSNAETAFAFEGVRGTVLQAEDCVEHGG